MAKKSRYKALIVFICLSFFSQGQSKFNAFLTPADTFNAPRFNTVLITSAAVGTGTLAALYQLWYADYPRSGFQFVNDNRDWLGMDKFGHALTNYYSAVTGIQVMRWAGVEKKKALWYGVLPGFIFMTTVEIFDGFSDEWGFSSGDFIANTAGAALAVGQEALWDKQRIMLKFSVHESPYRSERPEMLGHSFWESWLKDYNGQTYWISSSPGTFGMDGWPKWLCISAGYSGRGMVTGDPDRQASMMAFAHLERAPQFFASIDIDLTEIPVKNRFLKTLFRGINFIKIPMPTLQFSPNQPIRGHWLYF